MKTEIFNIEIGTLVLIVTFLLLSIAVFIDSFPLSMMALIFVIANLRVIKFSRKNIF